MIFLIQKISKWTMIFRTGHKSNNNVKTLPPVLSSKRGNRKIRRRKGKKDKKEYHEGKKKVIGKKGGILEINIYYYEIYK